MACIAPSKCDHGLTKIQHLLKKLQFVAKRRENNGEKLGLSITEVSQNTMDDSTDETCEKNSSFKIRRVNNISQQRRAAVLICLFEGHEGELRVFLTKRSMNLSTHPGEVALPGGKMDEEDADDSATALREAKEEIGLPPSLVHVVANLQPFISLHLLTVVPVVGLLTSKVEEFKPVLNADEVDAIFHVPLEMFLEEGDNHKRVEKEWEGWKYVCHIFEYQTSKKEKYLIGGLTASILIHAASIIYQRTPPFIENLPNFTQLQMMLKYQHYP